MAIQLLMQNKLIFKTKPWIIFLFIVVQEHRVCTETALGVPIRGKAHLSYINTLLNLCRNVRYEVKSNFKCS